MQGSHKLKQILAKVAKGMRHPWATLANKSGYFSNLLTVYSQLYKNALANVAKEGALTLANASKF